MSKFTLHTPLNATPTSPLVPTRTAKRTRTATRASPRQDLLGALLTQAREEVGGWVSDLVIPLVSDDHGSEIGLPPVNVPPTNLAEPDSKFIDVAGVHLHYKERKPKPSSTTNTNTTSSTSTSSSPSSSPPTVLLLHGFNGSVFNWRYALDAIHTATGLRAVAFDRPPFGLSQRPTEWGPGTPIPFNPYSLDGSAQLTEEFINQLGIDQVIVVGHSAGAIVAMELHERIPERIAAISLVAPAVPAKQGGLVQKMTLGGQLRLLAMRAILQHEQFGVRYVRRNILRQRDAILRRDPGAVPHASVDSVATYDELAEGYLKPLRSYNWDVGALQNLRSMSLPTPYELESKVDVPVLVVQGKKDSLVDNAYGLVERLQKRGGGAVTEFLELDCGHVPMEEMPKEFNEALSGFINEKVVVRGGGH